MSELVIENLAARIGDRQILRGLDLTVKSGEVHAIMGPNGAGKSTLAAVMMGRPGYTVTGGSVKLDGVELPDLAPYERAQAGMFFAELFTSFPQPFELAAGYACADPTDNLSNDVEKEATLVANWFFNGHRILNDSYQAPRVSSRALILILSTVSRRLRCRPAISCRRLQLSIRRRQPALPFDLSAVW